MFIRKSLTACLAVCTTLGVSASLTAGTTQFLESFDYENGTKAASQPLPWKLVLDHSSSLGVQDGVLVMNRGGERLLRFAPVMTGSAQVSISLDLQVNNKHAPDSARFDLLVNVDGGAWESLAHVRGLYEDSVTASLTTNQSFQL